MTEPPTDLALQAALKDFLVYQNAARRKHEREEFFRSCNLGLCILLGMALAVVTVHFTANLLWAILVLLAYIALLARVLPPPVLSGNPLYHEMEAMLNKLKIPELLASHLKNQTLTTLDEAFPIGDYTFIQHEIHGLVDGLWLSTCWLTGTNKLVRVYFRCGEPGELLSFQPTLCREDDQRKVLGLHQELYVKVYGEPQVVA